MKPNNRNGRIICLFCEKQMWKSNYKNHLNICIYKNDFNMPKSHVFDIVFPKKPKKTNLEIIYETHLFNNLLTLKKIRNMIEPIIDKLENKEELEKSPIEKIKEIVIKKNTQQGYISVWNLFTKFLQKNKKKVSKESANEYLSYLNSEKKNKISTIKKKKNSLERVLSKVLNTDVKLDNINQKSTYKEKYPMTEDDIKNYLNEQISIDYEDYIIQKLCITFSLRINSIALFKKQHFDFLLKGNKIFIPDKKTQKVNEEAIDNEFINEIKNFIEKKQTDLNIIFESDDYIFSPIKGNEEERIKIINQRINKRIKNSKVFNFKLPYSFSSHMFRKTQVFNAFTQKLKLIKDEARKQLRHSANTVAVQHYIGFEN